MSAEPTVLTAEELTAWKKRADSTDLFTTREVRRLLATIDALRAFATVEYRLLSMVCSVPRWHKERGEWVQHTIERELNQHTHKPALLLLNGAWEPNPDATETGASDDKGD